MAAMRPKRPARPAAIEDCLSEKSQGPDMSIKMPVRQSSFRKRIDSLSQAPNPYAMSMDEKMKRGWSTADLISQVLGELDIVDADSDEDFGGGDSATIMTC